MDPVLDTPSSREPLSAAPASVRSLTPAPSSATAAPARSKPPPKPVRPSLTPAPSSVASRPSATPPPPPSRRHQTPSAAPGADAKPYASWPRREAARVSIVKSTTEPGLFYVRVLEDGKQPFEGIEGLLVALGAEDTLRP